MSKTSKEKVVPTPVGNGYPVQVPKKTQTYRGSGATTKAKKISDKQG
jgi:hypothetical protein